MTGPQLAAMFPPRSDAWARKQIRAARAEDEARHGGLRAVPVPPVTPTVTRAAVTAPAKRHAPKVRKSTRPVPLVVVAVAASVMVGVVTGVSSYTHIRDLAVTHGMGELAGWLPFGVDGLVIACTCSLIVDRRESQRGSLLAWAGVVLGLVGSVAANVLAAPADPVSRVLAAYPPVALALSVHQVFRMLGDR